MLWRMDSLTVVNLVVSAVGALGGVTGVVALFQARSANKLSETANRVAQEANGIAEDANRLSGEANDLAAKANEISAHADSVGERSLRVAADQGEYKWRVEFDCDSSTLFVVNDCGEDASDISVYIRHDGEVVAHWSEPHVAAFGELAFKSPLLSQKTAENQRDIDELNASHSGITYIGVGQYPVVVWVGWTTQLGSHRSHEIKKSLTYGETRR